MYTADLIEKLLTEKFADFRNYHIWISLISLALIAVGQLYVNYRINQRLSAFNSSLKKTEIKFSKFHIDQVEAYKMLYQYFYNYRASTKRLLYFDKKDADHRIYIRKIDSWLADHQKLRLYFHQNRILFTESMCLQIDENFLSYAGFTSKVISDKNDLEDFEIYHGGDFMQMYGDEYTEIDKIMARARSLRESKEYKDAGKKSFELIKDLESEFRLLTN